MSIDLEQREQEWLDWVRTQRELANRERDRDAELIAELREEVRDATRVSELETERTLAICRMTGYRPPWWTEARRAPCERSRILISPPQ